MKTEQKKNERGQDSETHEKEKSGSGLSLSRIEAEGERFLTGILGLFEKYIPEDSRDAFDGVAEQAGKLFDRWSRNIEEHAKELVEKLEIPTRQDLEGVEKKLETVTFRLKENLDEQMRKALNRLDIATKEDVDNLAETVERLKKDLAETLLKPSVPPKKRTTSRKAVQA